MVYFQSLAWPAPMPVYSIRLFASVIPSVPITSVLGSGRTSTRASPFHCSRLKSRQPVWVLHRPAGRPSPGWVVARLTGSAGSRSRHSVPFR